jgi:alkylation response protein AidB-like acyl-CoA dehydrogenase
MFPVRPLLRFGTDEQRERYLPRLASDDGCLAAIAFTEAEAGSDVRALQATARRDGDAYVLRGEKVYVTNGGIAEVSVVFAKLDGEITAFLVERGDRGVAAGRKERKLGLRASYTGTLVLDDARIPDDRRLGAEGEGFFVAMDFFEHSRPQVAAAALGVARAAFETATDWARGRRTFGRPLIDRQGVSFKLAEMGMMIDARRCRCGPDPRRRGDHARAPRGEVAARRESLRDRRGHERDPAADRGQLSEAGAEGATSVTRSTPLPPLCFAP